MNASRSLANVASAFVFLEREGGAAAEGFEAGCEAGTSGTGGCGVGMQPTTVLLDVSRGSVKEEEEEEEEEEGGGGVNVVGWSSGSTPGFRHSISCVEEEEEVEEVGGDWPSSSKAPGPVYTNVLVAVAPKISILKFGAASTTSRNLIPRF